MKVNTASPHTYFVLIGCSRVASSSTTKSQDHNKNHYNLSLLHILYDIKLPQNLIICRFSSYDEQVIKLIISQIIAVKNNFAN